MNSWKFNSVSKYVIVACLFFPQGRKLFLCAWLLFYCSRQFWVLHMARILIFISVKEWKLFLKSSSRVLKYNLHKNCLEIHESIKVANTHSKASFYYNIWRNSNGDLNSMPQKALSKDISVISAFIFWSLECSHFSSGIFNDMVTLMTMKRTWMTIKQEHTWGNYSVCLIVLIVNVICLKT